MKELLTCFRNSDRYIFVNEMLQVLELGSEVIQILIFHINLVLKHFYLFLHAFGVDFSYLKCCNFF